MTAERTGPPELRLRGMTGQQTYDKHIAGTYLAMTCAVCYNRCI